MSSPLFLIDEETGLQRLEARPYDSEDRLQGLIASHPQVLGDVGGDAGDLILIQREFAVPDSEAGAGRWSIDHLFVDRAGVPILVEVKRASDTRTRREVVAQMLDYAANGVSYWSSATMIEAFERTCLGLGKDPNDVLSEMVGPDADSDSFWRRVEDSLRSGNLRMVFVADQIPRELQRIVEFLNEQMRPAEVIAIEIPQYVGADGQRSLAPRVIGNTERARATKSARADRPAVTITEWLDAFAERHGVTAGAAADRVREWLESQGCEVGVTKSHDAIYSRLRGDDGNWVWPFYIRSGTGGLETSLMYLRRRHRFAHHDTRQKVIDELARISRDSVAPRNVDGWPAIDVALLADDEIFAGFADLATRILRDAKLAE